MQVLITGGSGFIGRSLRRTLDQRDVQVFTYDPSHRPDDPRHVSGSITNATRLRDAIRHMDVVFHLAGVLGTHELMFQGRKAIRTNVEGAWNVLEACVRGEVPRVFFPAKPNDWLNTYSITKRAAESFFWMFSRYFGRDVRVLRWRNIYGPGQAIYPVRKAIPIMILQALANQPIEVFGSGEQVVDLEYIDDACRITAAYTLADRMPEQTLDTGVSVRITVNELAAKIVRLTGSTANIAHVPMRLGEPEDDPLLPPQEDTAASLLGDPGPTVSIDEGLQRTIDYYAKLDAQVRSSALEYHACAYSPDQLRFGSPPPETAEGVVIVLGAPNNPDGSLSPIAESRVVRAAEVLKFRERWICLPSGGFGAHFNTTNKPHWQYVRRRLVDLGIDEARILNGINSRNTVEDACFALTRMADLGVKKVGVVSSDFHMPRVVYWFDRVFQDFEIEYFPATADLPRSQMEALIDHESRALERLKGRE